LIKRRNIDAESYKSIAGLPPVGWWSGILRRSTDARSDDEKEYLSMKEVLLAFASGGLVSALAIELAFNSPNIPSDNDGARARYLVADL